MSNMIAYILTVEEQIIALSKDRPMIEAYNGFKKNIGKVQIIPKNIYKQLSRELEDLVLEESEYRVPLTHKELIYADSQIGEINTIVEETIGNIRRTINFVDEDDQKLLISTVKKLGKYRTPKKAFRKINMAEVLSEVYCDDHDNNIIEKSINMPKW